MNGVVDCTRRRRLYAGEVLGPGMGKLFEEAAHSVTRFRLQSCCWVAPLRPGVFLLGYLNLILSVVLIVGVVSDSFTPTMKRVQESFLEEASGTVCVLGPTTELAFSVLLLCAMHREDVVLMRVYVYYGVAAIMTSLIVYSVIVSAISPLDIIVVIINMLYQAYIIVLVRSVIVEIGLESATDNNHHCNNNIAFIYHETNARPVKMPDVETPLPDEPVTEKIPEKKKEGMFKLVTRPKLEETRPKQETTSKREETTPNPEEIKRKQKETRPKQAETNPEQKESGPKQETSGSKVVTSGSKVVASGSKPEETRLETVEEDIKLETVSETPKKKRSTSRGICRTS